MRVLIVSHLYPHPLKPYAGRFVRDQAMALAELGHVVTVVAPLPHLYAFKAVLQGRGLIRVHRCTHDGKITLYRPRVWVFPRGVGFTHYGWTYKLAVVKILRATVARRLVDVVHAHGAFPEAWAVASTCRRYGIPLVVTIHGQDLQSTIHRGKRLRCRVEEALERADAVIVVSQKLARELRAMLGSQDSPRVAVIPNGYTPPEGEIFIAKPPAPRSPGPCMVSVGNLYRTKGHALVIECMPRLLRQHQDLQYVVVGEGPERYALERLAAKLGVSSHVRFVGSVPHDRIWEYLLNADLFVLPSSPEAFGIAYLEALAVGVPIVGCVGEGAEEIVQQTGGGLLVRPNDVDDLCSALERLLADTAFRTRLGREGMSRVRETFQWRKTAQAVVEVYRWVGV